MGGIGITDRAVREWNALLFYWITGRKSVLFPGPMSEISRYNIHRMHTSYEHYDEPETLPSSIHPFYPISADGGQLWVLN
jgi:hypothetical protein